MGIPGLLRVLNEITRSAHIREYEGKKIAIDMYCWLHRGAVSCSKELCLNQPTDKYIQFCLKRLNLLRDWNITPIAVFDGGPLPAKKGKEIERRKNREENRMKGEAFLKQGNIEAANECFKKAVDITPRMAFNLINILKQEKIEYIVAPYEADAQLAFLSLGNYVDCVISEDGDLLAYGCKKVFFKMDNDGNGQEVDMNNLGLVKNPSFLNFTLDMFRQTCMLAGCDYLPPIQGLGIKKAAKFMAQYRNIDKVFKFLRISHPHGIQLPNGFEEQFKQAELTFRYQRVFDHTTNKVVTLNACDPAIVQNPVIGPPIPDDIALKIAVGSIDPATKEPFLKQTEYLYEKKLALPQYEDHSTFQESNFAQQSESSLTSNFFNSLPIQKNSVNSYFIPTTMATKKPFTPPRLRNGANILASENENHKFIIAPRSPPSPPLSSSSSTQQKIIVSKYFSQTKENEKPSNFSSPLLQNSSRISLSLKRTFSSVSEEFAPLKKKSKYNTFLLSSSESSDQQTSSSTVLISSDPEEEGLVIKSDLEDEESSKSVNQQKEEEETVIKSDDEYPVV